MHPHAELLYGRRPWCVFTAGPLLLGDQHGHPLFLIRGRGRQAHIDGNVGRGGHGGGQRRMPSAGAGTVSGAADGRRGPDGGVPCSIISSAFLRPTSQFAFGCKGYLFFFIVQVATASRSCAPFPHVCATLCLTDVLLIWECDSCCSSWCFWRFTSPRCLAALAATAEHVHVVHHSVAAAWLAGGPRRARVRGATAGEWSMPSSTTGLPGASPCHPDADLGARPYLKRLSFHATMTTLLATQTATVNDAVQQKQV